MLSFHIDARIPNSQGRAGTIKTPHGEIQTPAFIPVGTKATIKSLTPEQVASLGADAILANTYHLYLQPGAGLLKKAGGLARFMNWKGPTFTDSGGFQAFSLGPAFGKRLGKVGTKGGEYSTDQTDPEEQITAAPARIDDDGVTFKSVIDGSMHRFTPETSIKIQHDIGADIIFAFDECLSPHESYEKQRAAVERTHTWARRCLDEHTKLGGGQSLFGIVQGGRHEDLRRYSAKTIGTMDFDGFGIGGSFDKDDIGTAVGWVCAELPENKPRHLLGIGEPEDLILGIENGIDTFDCVAPTRIARNGAAYIPGGRINVFNAKFVDDLSPLQDGCGCYTCTHYSRAYIAHLFRAKEMLAATLTSIHNLYFLVHLVKDARDAICAGTWEAFKAKHLNI